MITVSNSFKEAIKSPNRQIYGYVDVKYQNKDFEKEISKIPQNLSIISDNGIISGNKVMNKYATLENNYTLLDGSFMVWNENTIIENGYISEDIFGDIQDNEIIITNESTDISSKGVTIYFRENLPFDFVVKIIDINDIEYENTVTNNESYVYQYIFEEELYIKSVSITISSIEYPDDRIRISYIDFNLSELYEGDELISFDVDEELDLMIETLPTNTCTIKLNNYPDLNGVSKFDIINQKGIVNYLTDNTTIEPYIGVLTKENGIEYVPMGVFYLSDWSSNQDGNVTFNGVSAIGKLSSTVLSSDGSFLQETFTGSTLGEELHKMTGFEFDLQSGMYYSTNRFLKKTDLLSYFQSSLSYQVFTNFNDNNISRKLYMSRDGVVTFNRLNEDTLDMISQKELLNDINYQVNQGVNMLEISDVTANQRLDSDVREDVIKTSHTLSSEEEYVWYTLNKLTDYTVSTFDYTVTSGSGSAQIIDKNYWLVYIKFTGTPGTTINITYNGFVYDSPAKHTMIFKNNLPQGNKITLDYYDYGATVHTEWVKEYYLNHNKPYKITAETIGDPSLEIGDTISIQTRYKDIHDGYRNMIITKQHFTFDGGLRCSIDGVGD